MGTSKRGETRTGQGRAGTGVERRSGAMVEKRREKWRKKGAMVESRSRKE